MFHLEIIISGSTGTPNSSHSTPAGASSSGSGLMQDLLAIPVSSQHQETLVTWDGGSGTITGYTLEGIIPDELRHQANASTVQVSFIMLTCDKIFRNLCLVHLCPDSFFFVT